MDPSAPKNNQNPQSPNMPTGRYPLSKSPIQPGQFVVAGEEDGVFKQPPAPASPPINPSPSTLPKIPEKPLSPPSPLSPSQGLPPVPLPQEPSAAGPNLSSFKPPVPPLIADLTSQQETSPSSEITQVAPSQPDPTPFVAQKQQGSSDQNIPQSPQEPPSLIKKLRLVAIVIFSLVLVAVILFVVWFFVLGKKPNEPVKIDDANEIQVEEPVPLPKRTTGGFADLPQATDQAEESIPETE